MSIEQVTPSRISGKEGKVWGQICPLASRVLKSSKCAGSNRANDAIPYRLFHVSFDDLTDQVQQAQDKIEYESDAQ